MPSAQVSPALPLTLPDSRPHAPSQLPCFANTSGVADVTDVLRDGKNEVALEVVGGRKNILGPLHTPWSRASKRRSRLGKTTALSPTSWDHPEKCGAPRYRRHPFGAVNCAILQMQHRSSGFSQSVPRNDPTSNLPLFPRPDSLFLSFRLDRMGIFFI